MEGGDVQFLASWFGGLFYGIGWSDVELFLDFVLWTFFVWFGLGGLDLTSPLIAMMYVVYCVFLGVALVFALQQKHADNIKLMFLYVLGFAFAASARWVHAYVKEKSKSN